MLLKNLQSETQLPNPIYKFKPYVLLSKDNIILSSGNFHDILSLPIKYGNYYDDCFVDIRKYDLFMNDNTKITDNFKENSQTERPLNWHKGEACVLDKDIFCQEGLCEDCNVKIEQECNDLKSEICNMIEAMK